MELVVDANVIFSALIKSSHTRHILLTSGWTFHVPEFLFQEVERHSTELAEKTGLGEVETREILNTLIIVGKINITPVSDFKSFLEKANDVSPDPDDSPYFALALFKKCALWSNDKKLKEQKIIRVYATEELSYR
jgi:predicted nucleic acid-binding protein